MTDDELMEYIERQCSEPPEDSGNHRKHPRHDYCVFCLGQWPCEEASEEGL